ncbi:MAG: hypothetical protein HFE64_00230 [Lachnospiraceae bacterium]|nr:hypothetical protein [Lachnospiraceae bacterium]
MLRSRLRALCLTLLLLLSLSCTAGCSANKEALSIPALAQQMLEKKEDIASQFNLQTDDYTAEQVNASSQEEKLILNTPYSFAGNEFAVSLYIVSETDERLPDYRGCMYAFNLTLKKPDSEVSAEQFAEIADQAVQELNELLPTIGTIEYQAASYSESSDHAAAITGGKSTSDMQVIRMEDGRRIDVAIAPFYYSAEGYYELQIKFNGATELIKR